MDGFFIALSQHAFLQTAVATALLASIGCGVMGTYVVVKRIAFIAGGIAHSVLGGMGAAVYFGFEPLHGALPAAVAAALLIGWVRLQGRAQEGAADPLDKSDKVDTARSAEERIEAILDQPLKAPLDFTEVPLIEIIDALQEEYDIPIVFDKVALDEMAISPETEVTVNLRNIALRSALNLILKQPGIEDLAYVIDNEVLLTTTRDRADDMMDVRVYRVDDLDLYAHVPEFANGASASADYSPLIGAIADCVDQTSWSEHGTGRGEIRLLKPGILVVYNTPETHSKLKKLLIDLRQMKAEIESHSALGETNTAAALAE